MLRRFTKWCQAEYRPLAADGLPASFVLTTRTSIDEDNPEAPDAVGESGAIATGVRGAGVRRATCSGNDDIAGAGNGRDEELIFTFDQPVRADRILLGLNEIDFASDEPVLFVSGVDGISAWARGEEAKARCRGELTHLTRALQQQRGRSPAQRPRCVARSLC